MKFTTKSTAVVREYILKMTRYLATSRLVNALSKVPEKANKNTKEEQQELASSSTR